MSDTEPCPDTERTPCNHGVTFDYAAASEENMPYLEVRKRWPRLVGECPLGCGHSGIAYASLEHFVYGEW